MANSFTSYGQSNRKESKFKPLDNFKSNVNKAKNTVTNLFGKASDIAQDIGSSNVVKGVTKAYTEPIKALGNVATSNVDNITSLLSGTGKGKVSKDTPSMTGDLNFVGAAATQDSPSVPARIGANLDGLSGVERQRAIEESSGLRTTLAATPETTANTTTLASTPDTTFTTATVSSPSSPSSTQGSLRDRLRQSAEPTTGAAGRGAITPEQRIRQVLEKERAAQAEQTQNRTAELQAQYLNLLKPSSEEQSLADQLASFDEAAQLGISNLEGQGRGISLDLIRGEQGKLAKQAEIQRQTILDRLANATAQRQAEASALQAQLGFQTQQDQLDLQRQQMAFQQSQANQPFEFNGNLVQLDPTTGQLKTIAEGATVVPGTNDMQEYQFAVQTGFGGSFLDYLQAKSGGGSGFSLSPGQTRFDQFGNAIATAFDPQAAQEVQAQQQAQIQQAQGMASKVELLDGILNNTSGINTAVGTGLFSRSGLNKGAQQRLLADVEQLISRDTLDSLINLKAQGGTLGALSDSELALLQSSANKISTWLEDDKIKAKESDFINEVNRIKGLTLKALDSSATGGVYTTMLNNGSMTPAEYQDVVMGLAYQPSFSQDLSTSQNGSVLSLGAITGYGSPLWEHGLDIDLKKGDPVPSPTSGVVTYVGPNGGFGNQVKVMDQFGNEHWLSHLDATGVQVGQQIGKGTLVGLGGNSGSTIPGPNGDGSHLDYTVVNAQGQYIPPAQIEQYVRNNAFV
jgi:murein DD-endopeptidase MepM/ murein hydrolase activator NlpD